MSESGKPSKASLKTAVTPASKRGRAFRNAVLLQISITLTVLLMKDFLEMLGIPHHALAGELIFLCLGGAYLLLLWSMLRLFTPSKTVRWLTLGTLLASYAATLVAANPVFHLLAQEPERKVLLIIHIALFIVEGTLIYYTIRENFKDDLNMSEKMWGSACVFFMIGISFGSLYDIICLIQPGSLGVTFNQGLPNYMECIHHSFTLIGGLDPDYANASPLIKKIAVVETVWSNLFVVVFVGRLLSK
jgi:hypothetical protein